MSSENTMWALVKEKAEPGLWLKKVEIPKVGKNEDQDLKNFYLRNRRTYL